MITRHGDGPINSRRYKSGFNVGHLVDPLNLVSKKSDTGNAAWWDPFGGLSGTNPKEEAARKAAQDAINRPTPLPPTKGEAARNVQLLGIASINRTMGRASTILASAGPEDRLNSVLG